MKKLLAIGCCIIAFQSFSQIKPVSGGTTPADGKRVLIKAIAVIVNTEAARKMPPRRIYIPNSESPNF